MSYLGKAMKNANNPDIYYEQIEVSEMSGKMIKYLRIKARITQLEIAKWAGYNSKRSVMVTELQETADPYWVMQLRKMYVKKFDMDASTLWNQNI